MRTMEKQKGVISIFLVLILLPVFIFSSVIIDGARYQAAKSLMNSTGDLAMNAGLSNFNTTLKDVYGLMAMAETPSAMQDELKKYVQKMLSREIGSGGATSEYSEAVIQELGTLLQNYEEYEYKNLLNLHLTDDGFQSFGLEGSALSNPRVMEKQILEYMKYRGPLTIVSNGLLAKFAQFKGVGKQMEAVEAETEYQETYSEVGEALEAVYFFLESADATIQENKLFSSTAYLGDIQAIQDPSNGYCAQVEQLWYCLDVMRQYEDKAGVLNMDVNIHWEIDNTRVGSKVLKLLMKTHEEGGTGNFEKTYVDGLPVDISDAIDGSMKNNGEDERSDYKEYETFLWFLIEEMNATGLLVYDTDKGRALGYLGDFYQGYKRLEPATDAFNVEKLPKLVEQALYYKNFMANCFYEETVYREYFDLLLAYTNVYKEYVKRVEEQASQQTEEEKEKEEIAVDAELKKYNGFYEKVTKDLDKNTILPKFSEIYDLAYKIADAAGSLLSGTAKHYCATYNAILYVDGALKWIAEAEKRIADLDSDREAWQSKVDAMDDGEVKTTFSARISSSEEVNATKLAELKSLVEENKKILEGTLSYYEMNYYISTSTQSKILDSKEMKSIYYLTEKLNVATRDVLSKETKGLPVGIKEAGHISKEKSGSYEVVSGEDFFSLDALYADFCEMDLEEYVYESGEEAIAKKAAFQTRTELYNFSWMGFDCVKEFMSYDGSSLYEKFADWFPQDDSKKPTAEQTKEADNNYDKLQGETDADASATSTPEVSKDTLTSILNSFKEGGSDNKGDNFMGSMSTGGMDSDIEENDDGEPDATEASDDAKGLLAQARKLVSQLGDIAGAQVEILYLTSYVMENFSHQTTNRNSEGIEITEVSEMDTTLSGYLIDPTNNYAYRAEVEYILWGDPNVKNNVNTTNGIIYGVRFALNSVYAFTAPQIQSVTNQAATVLCCGFAFLQPLINVVVTLMLSAAESGIDLKYLKEGKDVVIYKDAKTWRMSITGAANMLSEEAEKLANKAIDDVFDKIEKVSTDKVSDLTQIGADYIEEVRTSLNQTISDTILSPLINRLYMVAGNIDKTIGVDAMKETLREEIVATIDKMKETIGTGDSVIEKAELAAIAKLEENLDSWILDPVAQCLDEYGKTTSWVEKLDELLEEKTVEITGYLAEMANSALESVETELNNTISEACKKGGEAAKEGASKAIKTAMGKITGSVSKDGDVKIGDLNSSTALASMFRLNYKEYLTAFVIIGMQSENNRYKMLERTAALIQLNLTQTAKNATKQEAGEYFEKDSSFKMANAYTMIGVIIKCYMNTLFLGSGEELTFENMGGDNQAILEYGSFMGY